MAEMKDFFKKVIDVLETNDVDYVIVGGLAAVHQFYWWLCRLNGRRNESHPRYSIV